MLPGGRGENVAASPTTGEFGTGAAGFRKLLPADVGKVREVSLLRLIKGMPNAPTPKKIGLYDGDYAVVRDGDVGYLVVNVMRAKAVNAKGAEQDPCAACVHEDDFGVTMDVVGWLLRHATTQGWVGFVRDSGLGQLQHRARHEDGFDLVDVRPAGQHKRVPWSSR
ncbi:hypothetical protein ABZ468_35920 [Streptomyces sp. NPDC005708]|uniref:hypothetical protein n=1 Tax=unclassified Streptomyces TaxID=2593676 RepID=UPI0033EE3CFB